MAASSMASANEAGKEQQRHAEGREQAPELEYARPVALKEQPGDAKMRRRYHHQEQCQRWQRELIAVAEERLLAESGQIEIGKTRHQARHQECRGWNDEDEGEAVARDHVAPFRVPRQLAPCRGQAAPRERQRPAIGTGGLELLAHGQRPIAPMVREAAGRQRHHRLRHRPHANAAARPRGRSSASARRARARPAAVSR